MKINLMICFMIFVSTSGSAEVYKCIDASGNKIYKAMPCSDGQKKLELNVKAGSSTDLDAQESQKALSEQEKQAQDAQKKQEEDAARQKLEKFKQDSAAESAKNQFLVKNNPKSYSAFAIPPYDYDKLTPMVKQYQARLPDIERMRRESAEKVLATGQCGRVESAELSEKSNNNGLVFLIDCSSAKKFYISEAELTPSAPQSNTEAASGAENAMPAQPAGGGQNNPQATPTAQTQPNPQ